MPPPANAGRVVGGRPSASQDRYRDDRSRDRDERARDRSDRPVDRRDRPVERPSPRNRPAPRTSDARWQPHPETPPPHRAARPGLVGVKVVVALVSALVLVGTGYYSSRLNGFADGLTTADVIEEPPVEKPPDGAIDILMVGMDSRTDAQGHPLSKDQLAMLSAGVADGELNTDTLIMVRIPNDGGPAVGVSIPRDSYVQIAGDYGKHKINSAYARAKNDAMNQLKEQGVTDDAELQVKSNQEGAKNLIATIQDLTGAQIDHYAEVNLLGFYDITNAIGGIDVCLNKAVKDRYSGANFPAGPQTLAGVQALQFVRQRHGLPNGDLDRIVRQQTFMSGMAKKVLSSDMLAPGSDTFDKLQGAIQKSVVLDKNWNVLQFAQQMIGITGGKVEFQTIPVGSIDLDTKSDGSAVEVDPDAVREFVSGLLGTKSKTSTSESAGTDDASANAKITVNVRNTTSTGGLAASVAKALTDEGFVQGVIGNASTVKSTVVRYASGEQANGDRVAKALGGNVQVEEDANLPAGTVSVLLGQDYSGPGASGSDSAADSGDGLAGKPMLSLTGPQRAQGQPAQPGQPGCVN